MTVNDLDGAVAVAEVAFPEHPAGRAGFAERQAPFPQLCFVLVKTGTVAGYLVTYPWPEGAIPPLDSLIGALPDDPAALYLHDLALLPEARGEGWAASGIALLIDRARVLGATSLSLVSVNAAAGFWQVHGFRTIDAPAPKLASYGDAARYMRRAL